MFASRHTPWIIAVAAALLCTTAHRAAGSGVVGTGTPASCTEAALDAALAGGGTVSFDCGDAATILISQVKTIALDTRIDGARRITLSGDNAVQVFRVEPDARLELEGMTIADGWAGVEPGGAVRNLGWLSIADSLLVANATRSFGGAISNEGECDVLDSELVDNSSIDGGGGIANFRTLTVSRSTLFQNSAGSGDYRDPGSGGGIVNYGSLTVANSTFSRNIAFPYDSGALFVAAYGGGLYNVGNAVVANCTFSRNRSEESCGGIANDGTMTIKNTLIAQSVGINCCSYFGTVMAASIANLDERSGSPDCGASFARVRPETVRLAGLDDNGGPTHTVALLPGSAAIGAGDVESCINDPVGDQDQRRGPRLTFDDPRCDIGAYEVSPGDPTPAPEATFFSMRGEPNNYILGNDSRLLRPTDGRFRVDHDFRSVRVDFVGDEPGIFWLLSFAAPVGRELIPGNYEASGNPVDPAAGYLIVAGEGRGCGYETGRFSVREAVYAIDGTVERFAVDFVQYCDESQSSPALFGSVRINSNLPTASPEPGTPLPTRTPMVPTPTAEPPLMPCVADCAQDGQVSVSDIVLAVRVILDLAPLSECTDADADVDGVVTIAELIFAVNSAVDGCR